VGTISQNNEGILSMGKEFSLDNYPLLACIHRTQQMVLEGGFM
jgi:hypothetical protein